MHFFVLLDYGLTKILGYPYAHVLLRKLITSQVRYVVIYKPIFFRIYFLISVMLKTKCV